MFSWLFSSTPSPARKTGIVLVRHAQYGKNMTLTRLGEEQARLTGIELNQHEFRTVYCDATARGFATAQSIVDQQIRENVQQQPAVHLQQLTILNSLWNEFDKSAATPDVKSLLHATRSKNMHLFAQKLIQDATTISALGQTAAANKSVIVSANGETTETEPEDDNTEWVLVVAGNNIISDIVDKLSGKTTVAPRTGHCAITKIVFDSGVVQEKSRAQVFHIPSHQRTL